MLRGRKKRQNTNLKLYRKNEAIRTPEVAVIDEAGNPLGNLKTFEALAIARERELDLVEVSPLANPPVCRIMEFGQFQYQQAKKLQAQKAKIKKVDLKELRLTYRMGAHDIQIRADQAKKFLDKGHKVKVDMLLKRRERAHLRDGIAKVNEFANMLSSIAVIESPLKVNGGQISITFNSK